MTWSYISYPILLPLLFTLFSLIALSFYGWLRRNVPGALPFAVGAFFSALFVGSSIIEVTSSAPADKIAWYQVQRSLLLPTITANMCFLLEYSWPGRWLTRRNLALLVLAPLLLFVMVATNHWHGLLWTNFSYTGQISFQYGPGYWVVSVFGYAMVLVNLGVYAWLLLHAPHNRWPVVLMLLGTLVSRGLYSLNLFQLSAFRYELDVLSVVVAYLTYAIALFVFAILDPNKLARQTVIQQMREGMFVLDPQGRVTSLNPAAQSILGISEKRALGCILSDLLPVGANWDWEQRSPAEICLQTGSAARFYQATRSDLTDWRGLPVGRLLLLQEITGQKHAQAQLIEQQRALAMLQEREQISHELHDNLGQVFAFVSTQGQAIRRVLNRGDLSTAETYLNRLIEVAHEADVDIRDSILSLRVSLTSQGLFPALKQYLARYEKNYNISTDLEKPDALVDGLFDSLVEVQLLRILQEALTNVRKHAGASTVRIRFAMQAGFVVVTIQDDGQGFDPAALSASKQDHVGVRVMQERAAGVGGSVSISSEPGRGTCVEVRVPLHKDH